MTSLQYLRLCVKTEDKPLRGDDYTCLSRAILLRHHLQQSFVQHPQLQLPRFLVTFHLGFAAIGTRVLKWTSQDDAPPRWREGRAPHKG